MITILKFLTYLSALLSIAPFLRPADSSKKTLLWIPKLLGGALSPLVGITGLWGALLGLTRRDWKLAGAGILGTGLAAKFIADIPASQEQFEAAFGNNWQEQVPATLQSLMPRHRISLPVRAARKVEFQRDVIFGQNPKSRKTLRADLWQPGPGTPCSGLGVIYAHGSGWRVGDKDLGTRVFFRRLAGQGHVILDIAYTLWPEADIPTMVNEFNQAILWMKENGAAFGVNPERIVVMGGSAGGHIALLAAYTPNHPAFKPTPESGDTSVRGVVAFYPPIDLTAMQKLSDEQPDIAPRPIDKAANAMLQRIFTLHNEKIRQDGNSEYKFKNMLAEILGGNLDEIPEIFTLLSPIEHIGAHCPPTLLLQGSDDVFGLAPPVRRFYQDLQAAGVPAMLVEFPHTEHGFDLLLPQVSPVAQAATYDVEHFLAVLV